jgi:crotonobetainyl-CoA:carnitine CoA-transferase CaiB-like acyl-CoA transferase
MSDLIAGADVLVTNLRPGAPERLGFGWEDIGLPGLLDEPPWDDRAVRVEREAELVALVAPRMLERSGGEWERRLADAGVPASPVRERDALFDDPSARTAGSSPRPTIPSWAPSP